MVASRSANAVPWIRHDQHVIFIRIDAPNELWRIRDRLQREREQRKDQGRSSDLVPATAVHAVSPGTSASSSDPTVSTQA